MSTVLLVGQTKSQGRFSILGLGMSIGTNVSD